MTIKVYGEGPLDAKIALVGEALGEDEVLRHRPFVGPTGQLLDRLMHVAGITRSMCRITNVIKERPVGNKISQFIKFPSKGFAEPVMTDEYRAYERLLYDEITSLDCNVVVALGNVPLYALTRERGITKWRGSILNSDVTRKKVIPTFHPSSALPFRNFLNQRIIVRDLIRAKSESDCPDLNIPERCFILKPSFHTAEFYLEALLKSKRTAGFDIEVVGSEISCISFAVGPLDAITIPFREGPKDYFTMDQEIQIWALCAEILEHPDICIVMQNAIFDSAFVFEKYGIVVRNIEDTMIAQGIVAPDYPKSLQFLTSVYTRQPYYKDSGKNEIKNRSKGLRGSDVEFWRYNALDSSVTLEILAPIKKDLANQNNVDTYRKQKALIEPLISMQAWGIRVDIDGMSKARAEVATELIELDRTFREMTGGGVDPASPKQLMKYFYIEKDYHTYTKRTVVDGQTKWVPTTDESALRKLKAKGAKEAGVLLKHRELSKLKGTYFDVKLTPNGRLSGAYRPVGTVSGRLSSSADIFGFGTNFQNIPKKIRRFLIADPGHVIYSVDLGQAENRVVAYIAPEPAMIECFEKGIDVHKRTASMIFGKPESEISGDEGSASIGDNSHSERFWGKKANHALNYGEGPNTFATQNEIPITDGKRIRNAYLNGYPGIRRYWEWIELELRNGRTLTACSGRKKKFLGLWNDALLRSAYSFIPQATVTDKLNWDGILFMYDNPVFDKAFLSLTIHDSIGIQVPLELPVSQHVEMLMTLKKSLESPIRWKQSEFSIPADVSVGYNFYDLEELKADNEEELSVELNKFFEGGDDE